jgi:hypothetical protein
MTLPPSCVDLIERIDENQSVPTNESTNMLEPDEWNAVLSRVTGTIYRGTERISSNALLNLLEVGPDPVTRQKVAKRHNFTLGPGLALVFPELVRHAGGAGTDLRGKAAAAQITAGRARGGGPFRRHLLI